MAKKVTISYQGKKLQITPVVNGNSFNLTQKTPAFLAPGRGVIDITKPVLSAETVNFDTPISCKLSVNGKNIAYISSEVMLQSGKSWIGPICREFLHSPTDREVRGIVHPHWMSENEIDFQYLPTIKLLYCGEGFTLACMCPEQYGVASEAQIWRLEGVYQRGGGEPFRARLDFDNQGSMIRKTGFYPISVEGLASPFELFFEDGDTFEPYITLLSDTGKESLATVNPIMLGGGNLPHWARAEAPKGIYHVGVVVEDFDGQMHRNYSSLIVDD